MKIKLDLKSLFPLSTIALLAISGCTRPLDEGLTGDTPTPNELTATPDATTPTDGDNTPTPETGEELWIELVWSDNGWVPETSGGDTLSFNAFDRVPFGESVGVSLWPVSNTDACWTMRENIEDYFASGDMSWLVFDGVNADTPIDELGTIEFTLWTCGESADPRMIESDVCLQYVAPLPRACD